MAQHERPRRLLLQLLLHPVGRHGGVDGSVLGGKVSAMNETQIKYMVERFLQWKLPENFNPDGGITFKKMANENTPWPRKNEPVGTNLLDADQATEMVKYMVEGMPR